MQVSLEFQLRVKRDYSDFKVAGLSVPAFQAALQAMLNQVAQTLKAKKDLNLLTNQKTGGALVHQPGVIKIGEQHNVMVIAIEPGGKEDIVLRLMFVDPDQYESLRDTPVEDKA